MRKGSIEGGRERRKSRRVGECLSAESDTQTQSGEIGVGAMHPSDLDSRSPYLTAMRAENRVPPGVSERVVTQMQGFTARPAIANPNATGLDGERRPHMKATCASPAARNNPMGVCPAARASGSSDRE